MAPCRGAVWHSVRCTRSTKAAHGGATRRPPCCSRAASWPGSTAGAVVPAQPRPVRPALARVGLHPDRVVYCETWRDAEVLPAMEEGLRHRGLAGVVGELTRMGLTPSRRLQLAAEGSGVTAFVLHRVCGGEAAEPEPSAARTRWRVSPAPSDMDTNRHLGRPRWRLDLQRCRGGAPARGSWRPAMRRVVSLCLVSWPTDRLRRSAPSAVPPSDEPLATVCQDGPRRVLAGIDAAARRAGLRPGMAAAQAMAMVPGLHLVPAEPEADAAALMRLGLWCLRYAPLVALDPPDGLLIDVAGAAHLIGGEAALVTDLAARLERTGLCARLALADTPGGAWALARFGPGGIVPPGGPLGPHCRPCRSRPCACRRRSFQLCAKSGSSGSAG